MYIITGGGTGVGKALAVQLAERGHHVLIIGRREALLKEAASANLGIDYLVADVSTREGRKALWAKVQSEDKIHGLIHNAGTIKPIKPISEIQVEELRQIFATNVEAPWFLTQQLYEPLKGGRVLNIGSGAAYFPIAGWSAYCVSKAALAMQTQCWQLECAEVAFANVMPGIIDTPMQALIREAENMAADKRSFFQNLKAQDKLVSSETVALFLSWLLLEVERDKYQSKEWDIYDESHHPYWLVSPYTVPPLE